MEKSVRIFVWRDQIRNNHTIEKYKFIKRFLRNIDFAIQSIVILLYRSRYIYTYKYMATTRCSWEKKSRLWHLFTSMRYRLPEVNHFSYTAVLSSLSKEFTRLRKREIEKRIRDAAGVVTFREISIRLIKRRLTRLFLLGEFDEKQKLRYLHDFHIEIVLYTAIDLQIRRTNTVSKVIDKDII